MSACVDCGIPETVARGRCQTCYQAMRRTAIASGTWHPVTPGHNTVADASALAKLTQAYARALATIIERTLGALITCAHIWQAGQLGDNDAALAAADALRRDHLLESDSPFVAGGNARPAGGRSDPAGAGGE